MQILHNFVLLMKKDNKDGGIGRLYKCETETHLIFGAVHFARLSDPNKEVSEVVADVVKFFGLKTTHRAAEMRYYRALDAFLGNEQ